MAMKILKKKKLETFSALDTCVKRLITCEYVVNKISSNCDVCVCLRSLHDVKFDHWKWTNKQHHKTFNNFLQNEMNKPLITSFKMKWTNKQHHKTFNNFLQNFKICLYHNTHVV